MAIFIILYFFSLILPKEGKQSNSLDKYRVMSFSPLGRLRGDF